MQTVKLKFENKLYVCDLPVDNSFTGQVALNFHFKEGTLMKAEIVKHNKVHVNNWSLDTGIAEVLEDM